MRHQRAAAGLAAMAILVAACGGGGPGSATQGPGAQATQTGGGGGGNGSKPAGWDSKGKVHYEYSGGISKSGDLGYVPAASVFSGGAASLSYTVEGSDEVLTIAINAGQLSVTYGGPEFAAPGAVCTTSNLNVSAPNASGSFDCNDVLFIPVNGAAMIQGGHVKGSFDAHN